MSWDEQEIVFEVMSSFLPSDNVANTLGDGREGREGRKEREGMGGREGRRGREGGREGGKEREDK